MIIDTESLKMSQVYKNFETKFQKFVNTKDRISTPLMYYLVFDIDEFKYFIKSEYEVTYNQIVLQTATIPSKKDTKSELFIKDYDY